jgi:hypothetical protein
VNISVSRRGAFLWSLSFLGHSAPKPPIRSPFSNDCMGIAT